MHYPKPNREEVHPAFHQFYDLVEEGDIYEMMKDDLNDTLNFLKKVPVAKENYRYQEDKWSIKEVAVHLVSSEVYFCGLTMRLTDGQNSKPIEYSLGKYEMIDHVNKDYDNVLNDMLKARTSSIHMLKCYDEELMTKNQEIKGTKYSPLSIAYINLGHFRHHLNIIKERYL